MADLGSTKVFGKLTVIHEAILKANAEITGDVNVSGIINGDGSGLTAVNATTLDSLDSAQFVRSDVDTNMSGDLVFDGTGGSGIYFNAKSGGAYAYVTDTGSGQLDFGSDDGVSFYETDASILCVDWSLNNQTYNFIGSLREGGNQVWHAGNVGSGSGLDADTVDGVQGSNIVVKDAGNTITSSGSITFGDSNTSGSVHFNNGSGSRFYIAPSDGSGWVWGKELTYQNARWEFKDELGIGTDLTVDGELVMLSDSLTPLVKIFSNTHGISGTNLGGNGVDAPAGSPLLLHSGGGGSIAYTSDAGSSYSFWVNNDGTVRTGGEIYSNGNQVWHTGNMGAGNGLDADTLDGQEGAFYQNASNLNTGKVPIARLTGSYDIDISGEAATAKTVTGTNLGNTGATGATHVEELDTAQKWANIPIGTSLFIHSNVGVANGAPEDGYGYFLKTGNRNVDGGWTAIWIGHNTHEFFVGKANTDTDFATWERAVVNGQSDTMLDGLTIPNINDWDRDFTLAGSTPSIYFSQTDTNTSMFAGFNGTSFYILEDSDNDGNHDGNPYPFQIDTSTQEGHVYGGKIWTSGNDGAGSGLDADTVDGREASTMPHRWTIGSTGSIETPVWFKIANFTGNQSDRYHISLFGGQGYSSGNDKASSGANIYVTLGNNFDSNDNLLVESFAFDNFGNVEFPQEIQATGSGFNWDLWIKVGSFSNIEAVISSDASYTTYTGVSQTTNPSGIVKPINKVWHTGNDGAGSGLDADTVDGKQLNQIEQDAESAALALVIALG